MKFKTLFAHQKKDFEHLYINGFSLHQSLFIYMFKYLLFMCLFCTSFHTFAQATFIKKTLYQNGAIKEKYSVLLSDQTVKHGFYNKFHPNPTYSSNQEKPSVLQITGTYENGLKTSDWVYYNHQSDKGAAEMDSTISYKNNIKTAVTKRYYYIDGYSSVDVKKDTSGKAFSSRENIAFPITYPASARQYGIEGKVFVKVDVTDDCSLVNPRIHKGVTNDLDAEALKTVDFMQKFRAFVREKTGKSCKNEVKTFTYGVWFRLE
jgi:TonB family protein